MPTGRELVFGMGIMYGIPILILLAVIFGVGYWIGGNSGADSAQGSPAEVTLGSHELVQAFCKYDQAIIVDEDGENKFVSLPDVCRSRCPESIDSTKPTFVTIFEKTDQIECDWVTKSRTE